MLKSIGSKLKDEEESEAMSQKNELLVAQNKKSLSR
jgi:hypothetical protein